MQVTDFFRMTSSNRPTATMSYVVNWGRSLPSPGIAQHRGTPPALRPCPAPLISPAYRSGAGPAGSVSCPTPPGLSGEGPQVGTAGRCSAWGFGPRGAATRTLAQAPGIQWIPPPPISNPHPRRQSAITPTKAPDSAMA